MGEAVIPNIDDNVRLATKMYREKIYDDIDKRYSESIHDNIIYLITGSADFKSEAIRKYREANLSVWNDTSKGRKLNRRSW